ncbi:MAG: helix-turn-helix transcriptional regulator [Bacteroidales bacterium]|nr:helix-turn-helix transcriptional regulator [Bacteroidales bacterium]
MNITTKIQRLRREKGWSVAKLARETDIPTVSLRVMLSREDPNNYSIKSLIKLADVLGVTVSYLTLEENETDKPQLTESQRKELINQFNKTIENYFELVKPGAYQEKKEFDNFDDDEFDD